MMNCPECGEDMEIIDTTFSNINTGRVSKGEKTGDIYECVPCDQYWLFNHITNKFEFWSY